MSEIVRTGRCFCGEVHYRVTGTPRTVCFCHCESCRRAAGAPNVVWATFPTARFAVTEGRLTVHASSPDVERGFCARCGTPVTYFHGARPTELDVTVATLDDAHALKPQMHIWVDDKLPWVSIDDGLPAYGKFRSDDP